jgi:hypothetical protein
LVSCTLHQDPFSDPTRRHHRAPTNNVLTQEMQRPKTWARSGSTMRLKAGSHPTGGFASVVTAGNDTFEIGLGNVDNRSPLCVRSTEMMSDPAPEAAPAPVSAAARPATARQPTTPIIAKPLPVRVNKLPPARRANSPVMTVPISDSPCRGE